MTDEATMRKYHLTGDICHPGVVSVECTEEQLRDLLGEENIGLIDEPQLHIEDEQTSPKLAGFIPDGTIRDGDGNDVELPDERVALEAQLKPAEVAFKEAGGRGVELAEKIDSLRAAIAKLDEAALRDTDHGDECPLCQCGTVEHVGGEVKCRGECGAVTRQKPLQITKGGDPDGEDYDVPEALAKEGFWLTVGKASVHIKDGDDGVSVSVYRLHGEMDDSLSEAWVTHGELAEED